MSVRKSPQPDGERMASGHVHPDRPVQVVTTLPCRSFQFPAASSYCWTVLVCVIPFQGSHRSVQSSQLTPTPVCV